MTADALTPQLLRSSLTHEELMTAVIGLAEHPDEAAWQLFSNEELTDTDARMAWATLVDAVRRRHPADIDDAAFYDLFACEQVEACPECVARPVGNIWPRLWSSSVRCVMHAIQHTTDVPVQMVRVSA